jgi:hypothetical protein
MTSYPSAREVAAALKGHKTGAGYAARCPCHDDRVASLGIIDGKDKHGVRRPFVTCFAGCDWKDVQAELERMGVWPTFAPKARSTLTGREP